MTHLAPPDLFDEIRYFVQTETGVATPLGPVQVMGFVDDGGAIAAGFMFERYTGVTGSVHVHWAIAEGVGLTRGMLQLVAIYVYDQLGVDIMYGEVRASEQNVRDIDERLGFVETATLPAYFPDDDLIIYSMTKRQCRWLPSEYKEPLHG